MTYRMEAVGFIRRGRSGPVVEVDPAYRDALQGLEGFSHVLVLYWFDRNDTPEKRGTLLVHPRKNHALPLTGVFATRSPRRPNPVAIDVAKILSVDGRRVCIDKTDAMDGTPVIDLKPYIPGSDAVPDAAVPEWVQRTGGGGDG